VEGMFESPLKALIVVLKILGVTILFGLLMRFIYFNLQIPIHLYSNYYTTTQYKQEGRSLFKLEDDVYRKFYVTGVNLSDYPKIFDDDNKEEIYLEWFHLASELGVETIRLENLKEPLFYEVLSDFNKTNTPLEIIQVIDLDDSNYENMYDAVAGGLSFKLTRRGYQIVDALHGNYKKEDYLVDVSEYVLSYEVGRVWNPDLVIFTNTNHKRFNRYNGRFLDTTEDTLPFERILGEVGDSIVYYESSKYGVHHLLGFVNSGLTDPLEHENIRGYDYYENLVKVDMNSLSFDRDAKAGFYHAYYLNPAYPNFLDYDSKYQYKDEPFTEYLLDLNGSSRLPVVLSSIGISTSLGKSGIDSNGLFDIGGHSELMQGELISELISKVYRTRTSGLVIDSLIDDWERSSWNQVLDDEDDYLWQNVMDSDESFGLVKIVDENEIMIDGTENDWEVYTFLYHDNLKVSFDYDNKYFYILVRDYQDDFYIGFDFNDYSGFNEYQEVFFTNNVDYLIHVDENPRFLVHQYSNSFEPTFLDLLESTNPYLDIPDKEIDKFEVLETVEEAKLSFKNREFESVTKQIGYLDDSLYENSSVFEIKIPWSYFNITNPVNKSKLGDFYEGYNLYEEQFEFISIEIASVDFSATSRPFLIDFKRKKNEYMLKKKDSFNAVKEGFNLLK
jgi:hypothetical protein